MKKLDFVKRNVWSIVLIGLLFSLLFPTVGILLSPAVKPMFMVIMFLSTLDIKLTEVIANVHRPGKTLVTLLIIHVVSPVIVLFLRHLFSEEIFLGLIIGSTINSGISVVFLTSIFGGEESRSLVITTISNLLSPITIPFLVFFFARKDVDVNVLSMSFTMVQLIIVPLAVAQLVAQKEEWKKKIEPYTDNGSVLLLFLIIIGIISPVRNYIFDHLLLSLQLSAVVAILVMINFLLGYTLGTTIKSKISYGITASFKNFTLSTVLALAHFGPVVALPAIVYAVINSFLLIPMQWFIEGQRYEPLEQS